VHQRWQVDFKLGIPLQNGEQVNLHTVYDPVGESCIMAAVTPAGLVGRKATHVTLQELQTTLRAAFIYWQTRPEEVQTDGEPVFAGSAGDDFPSKFTLWLAGLGIQHRVIRAGCPTDNAEVERCHRTVNEYAIIGNQHLPADGLNAVLRQAVDELAFELPSRAEGCAGHPPVTSHPELLAGARPFEREHEHARFDLGRVDAYLTQFTWQRKVGKTGQICIGGHHCYYGVGRAYARQYVLIRFDPTDRHYVFHGIKEPEQEIGRRPARGLGVSDLTGLMPRSPDYIPQQLPLALAFAEG